MKTTLMILGVLGLTAAVLPASAAGFEAKFESGLPGWEKRTGGNAFAVGTYAGEKALLVTRDPSCKGGTAWELVGEPFDVTPGAKISVLVRSQSTFKDLRFCHGYKGHYLSALKWYAKDGSELKLPFGFGYEQGKTGEWWNTAVGTTVPERAVRARLSLGFDGPNFATNDVLAIAGVRVIEAGQVPAESRVTLRDDGFVLVGGKPFFPIGIYAVSTCDFNGNSIDKALRDLKAAGFNLVHRTRPTPEAENEEFLSLADKYDLKVFTQPVPLYSDDFVTKTLIPKQIGHKSVLAWYLADDTASHVGPEVVSYRDRIVKAMDPGRLTLQADGVLMGGANCRYDRYVHSTDVFLPEIYPIYEKGPCETAVAEVIRDMEATREAIRKAGNPVKSIWPICQQFDGWGAWKRFPTFPELRAMSWASIIHGGHGITWYVYNSKSGKGRGAVASPEYWRDLTTVSKEMAALSADLVTRTPACQPEVKVLSGVEEDPCGFPSVTVLLKGGDSPLLMSVNGAPSKVSAAIGVRGFKTAEVLGENRAVDAEGVLVDDFEPFAVHLYRLHR